MQLDTTLDNLKNEVIKRELVSNEVKSTLGLVINGNIKNEVNTSSELEKGIYYSKELTEEQLIEKNMPLVYVILNPLADKFPYIKSQYDDFVSIGSIGLIKGARTFDPEKNVSFGTYTGKCIKNEILQCLRKNKSNNLEVSLDEIICTDNYNDNTLKIIDTIGINYVEDTILKENEYYYLHKYIDLLPERRRKVIIGEFFENKTQLQMGKELNVNQTRISKLRKSAIAKLKQMFDIDKQINPVTLKSITKLVSK